MKRMKGSTASMIGLVTIGALSLVIGGKEVAAILTALLCTNCICLSIESRGA